MSSSAPPKPVIDYLRLIPLQVPLSSLIILTGALSLTFGSCALFFADIFNHANVALAYLLNHFIAFLSAIPGGHWKVSAPPLWAILLAYSIMIITHFAIWVYARGKPNNTFGMND